ncbi:MAG: hypothetical protein WBB25_18185 [Sulfitobacter sp.]
MPVELHILGLTVVFFGVAYMAIYPRIEPKTLKRLMAVDIVLLVVLLGIAGSVYAGSRIRFSLVLFQTNWWLFTLLCAIVVETPLFIRFCRKWGIDLSGKG